MDMVRVIYHQEEDGWWAESPDAEAWSAAAESFYEVRALAVEGIPFVLGAGTELEHYVPAGGK